MARCPVCRRFSKNWTHVRPVCRDLVDSPPIPEAIPTAIAIPRFEPSVRRALQGICCATCHALSGLFCADRAPDTDLPREKRLRACASQQTVAAAAESSRGIKNSRKRSAKEAAAEEEPAATAASMLPLCNHHQKRKPTRRPPPSLSLSLK